MTVIEILEKRKEQLVGELDKDYMKHDIVERFRLEGQIREVNSLIFMLTGNKKIKSVE